MRARSSGSSAGEGDSSSTFWWRRWTEHSRSPSATTPRSSPRSWISTWRGRSTKRSQKTRSSPKAAAASRRAASSASSRASGSRTTRIPRPPPPAAALTTSGKPISPRFATRTFRIVLVLLLAADGVDHPDVPRELQRLLLRRLRARHWRSVYCEGGQKQDHLEDQCGESETKEPQGAVDERSVLLP